DFQLGPDGAKDLHVSRLHFLVEVNPPLCRLYDVNSRGGTFVNDQRVTVCDLHHGDKVRAGHTVLSVALVDDLGPTTAAAPGAPRAEPGPPAPLVPDFKLATVLEAGLPPPAPPGVLPPSSHCLACGAALPGPLCPRCRLAADGQPQPLPGYLLLREL